MRTTAQNGPSPGQRSSPWSAARAESHLRSLELFGMRFGLERMRRMMTALGSPQRELAAVHVVGTNGKSSTTRMIAAILARHGLRTGAYLSPHLVSYAERIQIDERDIEPERLGAAVERAAWAAERVDRTLAEDERVTQFELLTAAGLWELARSGVDVAVVEAGLGGRYDATSVIEAAVCVLTNVGLDHTRWLGPTALDLAAEKLAVVRHGATLVLGAPLQDDVAALARRVATEQRARIVALEEVEGADAVDGADVAEGAGVAAAARPARNGAEARATRPAFDRRNFRLARLAAAAHLERIGMSLRADAVAEAARMLELRGRFETVRESPLTIFDGAHNREAALALADALEPLAAARSIGLVLGVLEDKDAVGMLRALLPLSERAWFTAPPGPRALPPATLDSLARQLGFTAGHCEPRPARALEAASSWAAQADAGERAERPRRAPAAVLATGSIYLIGELMQSLGLVPSEQSASADAAMRAHAKLRAAGGAGR